MNPGFHLSCDEHLSKGWGPPLLGDGSALVVQFNGDGALLDLTYTSYDEAGDLNYGVSGAGTFSQECVQIKRLE